MIRSFALAIRQLPDPAFRRVLLRSLALTLATLAGLAAAVWFFLAGTDLFAFRPIEWIVDALGGIAAVVAAWLLFPAAASFFVGLFLDEIVAAVEARHYPDDPPARPAPLSAIIAVSLRFAGAAAALNLLALPFYAAAFWFPPLAIAVFYCLNGYLPSREYYELVALGRLDAGEAATLRKANRRRLLQAGVVIALLFATPVVNLFAPVVGVAAMTHMFRAPRAGGSRANPARQAAVLAS